MRDSRDVDSEAMSVIGNYKGSSTKQKKQWQANWGKLSS